MVDEMSRWKAPIVFAVILGFVVPVVAACNAEQREQQEYRRLEKQRRKAMSDVQERAEAFLLAMRWRDYQTASGYYEDTDLQVDFLRRMTEATGAAPTIESFTVDYVLVDEDGERAEVRVTLSEVDYRTQRLETRSETQLWYLADDATPKEWYLVPVEVLSP